MRDFLWALIMFSFLPIIAFLAGANYDQNHAWIVAPVAAVLLVSVSTVRAPNG